MIEFCYVILFVRKVLFMKVIEVLKGREYSLSEIIEYYYKVIETEVTLDIEGNMDSRLVYGIQIDKILIKKDGQQITDSEKVEIISCNLEFVREICRTFHKQLVSPFHLIDILEDNISASFRINSKIRFKEKV